LDQQEYQDKVKTKIQGAVASIQTLQTAAQRPTGTGERATINQKASAGTCWIPKNQMNQLSSALPNNVANAVKK